jgi:hypothetical protein
MSIFDKKLPSAREEVDRGREGREEPEYKH